MIKELGTTPCTTCKYYYEQPFVSIYEHKCLKTKDIQENLLGERVGFYPMAYYYRNTVCYGNFHELKELKLSLFTRIINYIESLWNKYVSLRDS